MLQVLVDVGQARAVHRHRQRAVGVEVDEAELERRRAKWEPVIHENGGRLLARYAKQVGSAKTGAVLR